MSTVIPKILLFILITGGAITVSYLSLKKIIVGYQPTPKKGGIYFQTQLRTDNWENIGNVSNPTIKLPVKIKKGFKEVEFLLDTGAIISSLPINMSVEMGKDLSSAKRIPLVGYGNTTSFAYKSTMNLIFNKDEIEVPVIFSEEENTVSLLGRHGFFDEYVVTFDRKHGLVTISN